MSLKQRKQIFQLKVTQLKILTGRRQTSWLLIKRDGRSELGATEKQIPLVTGWRPSNPGPPDYNTSALNHSGHAASTKYTKKRFSWYRLLNFAAKLHSPTGSIKCSDISKNKTEFKARGRFSFILLLFPVSNYNIARALVLSKSYWAIMNYNIAIC